MDALKISVFQYAASAANPTARLNALDLAAERAAGEGSTLLLCPELFISGYNIGVNLRRYAAVASGEYAQRVAEVAQLHSIAIAFGYPERYQDSLYNTAICIGPEGQSLAQARKIHLVSAFDSQWFKPGAGITCFTYAGWNMALVVGSDINFPEVARQAALAGADLLLVPLALAAGQQMIADRLLPIRAFENQLYLAWANFAGSEQGLQYFGASAILTPEGTIAARAEPGQQIVTTTLSKSRLQRSRAANPWLTGRALGLPEPDQTLP